MMPAVEVMPSNGAAAPIAAPPLASAVNPIPQSITTPPLDPSTTTATNIADDTNSDELDAEWVRKAKAIVDQTKEDPHRESHELGKVKADYMRIRYNKNIKVVEE
jgi:hypothetical protein